MALPAGSYSPASATYRDAGNEDGRFRCYGALLTTGNIVAQTTAFNALLAAMDALTLGVRVKSNYGNETDYAYTQPTNGAARELKLFIQARDDTNGQLVTCSLPTLDPTLPDYVININAKDVIRIDSPSEITDFVTAFEAFAINPRTGNALVVQGLKVVGRNT